MTSSCSEAPAPVDVALLKSWDFADWRSRYGHGWQLPYRMDHLERHGLRLHWTDALHHPRWQDSNAAAVVRRAEAAGVPFAQAALMAGTMWTSPVTLAMFESEANAVAAFRRGLPGRRRSALAVVTCWLAHLLASADGSRLAGYRWAYESVDRLYYFSANQGPVLADRLGIGGDRLRRLAFGVDDETFAPTGEPDGDYVLVVGRDSGRDWPTLFRALEGVGLAVKVCCRPRDIAGLEVPAGVELLGYVDRDEYRRLLGAARVVAIAARPVVYPSGQSVLLEAMAMARTVVATFTPALQEYLSDGETCLTVPVGHPSALRERIIEAASDDELRARVGRAARAAVERSYRAESMWAAVAADLLALGRTR
ncbi:MAG: glycosyltransferase family 4 protein [Acidimicrobiales bacterium]